MTAAPSSPSRRFGNLLLGGIAIASFLLLFHNYGLNLLPPERLTIPVAKIYPLPGEKSFAYVYDFDRSEPDRWFKPRSQVQLFENDAQLRTRLTRNDEVRLVGGDRWTHEPGRIVFATTDNSDPRANGRVYSLLSPRLYTKNIGYVAALAFATATLGLLALNRSRENFAPLAAESRGPARWRWHVLGASVLLLAGLYCNTGSLTPYGITQFGHVIKETGYVYNSDHPHFRALFDFVNGADAKFWNNALFFRRILFAVIAWPFMRIGGFEIGGTIASLVYNVAGLILALHLLRRRIGERGALFAGWLLALYPGAMYFRSLSPERGPRRGRARSARAVRPGRKISFQAAGNAATPP